MRKRRRVDRAEEEEEVMNLDNSSSSPHQNNVSGLGDPLASPHRLLTAAIRACTQSAMKRSGPDQNPTSDPRPPRTICCYGALGGGGEKPLVGSAS